MSETDNAVLRALAAIVAELREANAHSGFERPDGEYVDVQLTAGTIRRAEVALREAEG